MASTFEDARLCPKCGKSGEDTKSLPVPKGLPRGTRIRLIYCRNQLCPWLDTPWPVQVNPDGSIPQPKDHTNDPKVYIGFEGHDDMARQLIDELKASEQIQQNPGAEIRRRR